MERPQGRQEGETDELWYERAKKHLADARAMLEKTLRIRYTDRKAENFEFYKDYALAEIRFWTKELNDAALAWSESVINTVGGAMRKMSGKPKPKPKPKAKAVGKVSKSKPVAKNRAK